MKNKVLTCKGYSITMSAGDRIIYDKEYDRSDGFDGESTPFWGGKYGKIIGTILSYNDERYIKRFGPADPQVFPIRILWDNGKINGFGPIWIQNFTIISGQRQLKLF